eukprot:1659612-Pyramimonas_sp.AAC.1
MHESRCLDHRSCVTALGSWILDHGWFTVLGVLVHKTATFTKTKTAVIRTVCSFRKQSFVPETV